MSVIFLPIRVVGCITTITDIFFRGIDILPNLFLHIIFYSLFIIPPISSHTALAHFAATTFCLGQTNSLTLQT